MTLSQASKALATCLVLSCALASACGEGDEGDEGGDEIVGEVEAICDGSMDIRLVAKSQGGHEASGFTISTDLGLSYLYVRGDCHYWVTPTDRPPTAENHELRTGVLDDAGAELLAQRVYYGLWDQLEDSYSGTGSDEGSRSIRDGVGPSDGVSCSGNCPSAPEAVGDMFSDLWGEMDALWMAGEPYDGPMVVYAVELDPGLAPENSVTWDVENVSLSAVAEWTQMDMDAVIEPPEQLAPLRAFRAAHPEIDEPWYEFHVEFEGSYYGLGMRDRLPFEEG